MRVIGKYLLTLCIVFATGSIVSDSFFVTQKEGYTLDTVSRTLLAHHDSYDGQAVERHGPYYKKERYHRPSQHRPSHYRPSHYRRPCGRQYPRKYYEVKDDETMEMIRPHHGTQRTSLAQKLGHY